MDIVRYSIEKPVTVIVGVVLVVLFGWIGLLRMPYQLSPTVIEPEISVSTTWPGATPWATTPGPTARGSCSAPGPPCVQTWARPRRRCWPTAERYSWKASK